MNQDSGLSFKNSLFTCCREKGSGSFFLATSDNRSAQVVLHQGNLIGVNYADMPASDALQALFAMSELRHSFQHELIYPVRETLLPDEATALLEGFGFVAIEEPLPESNVPDILEVEEIDMIETGPELKESKVLMYRGQKVVKEVAQPARAATRIYRGQRIEG